MNIVSDFPLINAVVQKKQWGQVFNLESGDFIFHKAGFSQLRAAKNQKFRPVLEVIANE